MDKKFNTFESRKEEFRQKLGRLMQFLAEHGYEAVYLKRQDNFAWLTAGGVNYVSLGEMGNCGLLVTREGGLFAITNNIEGPRMVEEERLEDFGFKVLADIWYKDDFEAETLKRLVAGKLAADHASALASNEKNALQTLRYSLTQNEVSRYQYAGQLISDVVESVAQKMRPGMSELDFVAAVYKKATPLGITPSMVACASDERIDKFRHAIPVDKPIRERIQLGGNYRFSGLTVCLCRYVYFTEPTAEQAAKHEANIKIDCSFMANTIPGRTFADALQAGQAAYRQYGYEESFNEHHQGGPIGYQNRDCRVSFNNLDKIEENQAFCWNPSLRGSKSEDTMIATAEGPMLVSKPIHFPAKDFSIDGINFHRALPLVQV